MPNKVTNETIMTEIKYIRRDIDALIKRMDASTKRTEKLEINQAQMKQTQSGWNYGLAILNVMVGALAAFFGVKR